MVKIVWKNGLGEVYSEFDVRSNPESVREAMIKELSSISGELGSFGEVGDTLTVVTE